MFKDAISFATSVEFNVLKATNYVPQKKENVSDKLTGIFTY